MKIIIDTHIFLWALSDPTRIAPRKLAELETPTNIIYVSSITIAEIMIKTSIGKLQFEFDPLQMAERSGFEHLNFTSQDAALLRELPFHHRDPFDRMLICQSLNNEYPLMTDDNKIMQYNCRVI
jgi:PIN domain nuclease of toxin-antitoxin system